MPFHTRYRQWTRIPEAFRRFARQAKLERDWQDVLTLAAAGEAKKQKAAKAFVRPRVRKGPIHRDRPTLGRPLLCPELAHEPVNELGVVFVFGMLARRMGFVVQHLQPAFPDCEALLEVARGVWQRVRIEFEFESRNFLKHRHRKDGCDMIICWRNNWPDCPLEVIELSRELAKFI